MVVDDEALPRQRVRELVQAHPALVLVSEAADGAQALDAITEHKPDLVFLDIQMPELNGFQVIAALEEDDLPAIVFVTAYDEYALQAFEVDAVDYLLKPITQERFDAAVERVIGRVTQAETSQKVRAVAARLGSTGYAARLVARRAGKHYFVRTNEIDWLESEANYVRLHVGNTSHLVRDTMKDMEARLDPTQFVRIHRSLMVSIDRIQSVESNDTGEYVLTMRGGKKLTSSRGYNDRVRRLLR